MTNNQPSHHILSTSYTNECSRWYMVDIKWLYCMVFNIVHYKSFKWLNNDSHVGHVIQGELGRHHSRLMSCLRQWVIDSMVRMDKFSSSDTISPRVAKGYKWRREEHAHWSLACVVISQTLVTTTMASSSIGPTFEHTLLWMPTLLGRQLNNKSFDLDEAIWADLNKFTRLCNQWDRFKCPVAIGV
jgi:hypothetical protein